SAEAVLRYWSDFIPSWAGAISIDLLPVVLVLVLMIVHDAMRRETGALGAAETMSAAEMIRAMDLYRQLANRPLLDTPVAVPVVAGAAPLVETPEPAPPAVPPAEPEKPAAVAPATAPAAGEATVTPLGVGRKPSRS
ncbi:MAG TPA: hypothetical protein VHZ56_01745, partial [Devosia sp.]|nr:hypothetical protein [Devosia sp.]